MNGPRLRLVASLVFFAASIAIVLHASVLRGGEARMLDGRYLFVAGRCWLEGGSPYAPDFFWDVWRRTQEISPRSVFLYPPTLAALSLPLGLLPWRLASPAIDGLNLVALGVSLAALVALARRFSGATLRMPALFTGLALACLVSAVSGSLFIGQTTLLSLAGSLGAYACVAAGRRRVALLGIAVAMLKPQVGLAPVVALWVAGEWRGVMLAGIASLAAALAVVAATSGLAFPGEVAASLHAYTTLGANRPEALVGLAYALAQGSAHAPPGLGPVAGLGLVAAAGLRYRSESATPALRWLGVSLPFVATAAFLPVHYYDCAVLLVPVAILPLLPARAALPLLPGALLVWRPTVLAALAGGEGHAFGTPNAWATLGTFLLLAGTLVALERERRAGVSTPPGAAPRALRGEA